MDDVPEVRYARSGDLSIAYQVAGDGPPDIVHVPGFISHLDLNWETPFFGDPQRRFARMGRLVTFDKRGTGLSERTGSFGALEDRVDDIRAVMDAAGVERAHLVAISEGGPLAIMFATTYPERVEKLVLYATFARLPRAPDYAEGIDEEVGRSFVEFVVSSWGTGSALEPFGQHMPDAPGARELLARLERYTATPAMARTILEDIAKIDVRPLLGSVSAPTLVVHTTGDPMVPVAHGRYLAANIPGARMHEVDEAFHVTWDSSRHDLVLDAMEEFLLGRVVTKDALVDRILTTVMFTDIVGSTGHATEVGDAKWRALLDRHDAIAREEIARMRGREVKTTGDGFLATFDGPARAVRCAQAITNRVRDAGLEIRAGVHTGECELRGEDVAGIAVHVAARVMALADPGAVFTTRTVRDLVTGSGIGFESRGMPALRGVDEPIEVFVAS